MRKIYVPFFAAQLIIIAVSAGCSQTVTNTNSVDPSPSPSVETAAGNAQNDGGGAPGAIASPTPAVDFAGAAGATVPAGVATGGGAAARETTTRSQNQSGGGAAAAATPAADGGRLVASSGASDFALFTRVRGALVADGELGKSINNIVIEVKDGAVTLSGSLPSAAQKARAEQLAKSVEGVKSLKNAVQVSAAGPAAKDQRR